MRSGISVVVNTFNEEKNLPNALASVKSWADEIVVVDMHSSDETIAIARRFGAEVFLHENLGFADPARAFAVRQAKHEWICILDADEMIPPQLYQALMDAVVADDADVIVIPRLNLICGKPMRASGWGPDQDAQLRFFRKDAVILSDQIHNFIRVGPNARVRTLKYRQHGAIIHFNYLDGAHLIEKLNRYTTIEAQQAVGRHWSAGIMKLALICIKTFISIYIKKRGFIDGWRGFYLAMLMVFYRLTTYQKFLEIRTLGGRAQIEESYLVEARRVIASYNVAASS